MSVLETMPLLGGPKAITNNEGSFKLGSLMNRLVDYGYFDSKPSVFSIFGNSKPAAKKDRDEEISSPKVPVEKINSPKAQNVKPLSEKTSFAAAGKVYNSLGE